MSRERNNLKFRPDCWAASYLIGGVRLEKAAISMKADLRSGNLTFLKIVDADVQGKAVNSRCRSEGYIFCPIIGRVWVRVANHMMCYDKFF